MRRLAALLVTAMAGSCASPAAHYSGTVQTESISVGSQIGGRVVEVDVAAGSIVRRGSVIVRLDSSMMQAQLEQAIAQARTARAHLEEQQHGSVATEIARARQTSRSAHATYVQQIAGAPGRIAQARSAIVTAQAAVALADRTYARNATLAATGDVSQQSLDEARASAVQARAQLAQARAAYATLVSADLPGEVASARQTALAAHSSYMTLHNGTRPEEIAQAASDLENANAAVAYARARLREMVVRSTADGVVSSFNLHRGDMLGENQTAAIIDTFADPYAYIYASQRDLAQLRAGKHVQVRSDTGSGSFDAIVESFDRSAQFTPQNVETADQRAQLVYGVKIRIRDPKHVLLDGTTVTVDPP
jgi:HlyD family secretion protein